MSKKRDKYLMASEVHEQKQKEIKDFRADYNDWACSSAKWWTVRRPGKLRMEFQTGRWCFILAAIILAIVLLYLLMNN